MLVPVLFGIVTIVFIVMRLFSPDPAAMMLGKYAGGDAIEALRQKLGLDQPVWKQYIIFIGDVIRGDFGDSLFSKTPVFREIMIRFPATLELAFISIIISSIFGILIGTISAVKQYSIFDYTAMFVALVGVSIPIFWLALMLILGFAVNLHWLPVSGRLDIGVDIASITGFYIFDSIITGNTEALISSIRHIILPAISLAVATTALTARMTRTTMLEVIRQDYMRTARAKGLSNAKVIIKHGLRNGMIPIITIIGLQLGTLMGGAVLTETIFSWPGVGNYIVKGIMSSDYPVVQAGAVLVATVFVLVNLLVDILYAFINPRIRYTGRNK